MRFSDIKEFQKVEHLQLTEYQGISGGAIVLEFNNRTEHLSNKKVRQAIAYAVNRSQLSECTHIARKVPNDILCLGIDGNCVIGDSLTHAEANICASFGYGTRDERGQRLVLECMQQG